MCRRHHIEQLKSPIEAPIPHGSFQLYKTELQETWKLLALYITDICWRSVDLLMKLLWHSFNIVRCQPIPSSTTLDFNFLNAVFYTCLLLLR